MAVSVYDSNSNSQSHSGQTPRYTYVPFPLGTVREPGRVYPAELKFYQDPSTGAYIANPNGSLTIQDPDTNVQLGQGLGNDYYVFPDEQKPVQKPVQKKQQSPKPQPPMYAPLPLSPSEKPSAKNVNSMVRPLKAGGFINYATLFR